MKSNNAFAAYILLLINALGFSGCDIVNPPEDVPAYIRIKEYTFTTDAAKQGTASNKITDAWVYAGNTFQGGFEMPATIPTLETGTKRLTIIGGVKENGISATRLPYPFLESYSIDIDLKRAKVDTIKPVWKYSELTKFPWLENFEGTSVSLELSDNSTTGFRITTTSDSAFEGNSAIKASIDPAHNYFECKTKMAYGLPRGKAVWLEMNYKTEVPVEVGVYSIGASGNMKLFAAGINPSAEWNKIYVNLTSTISYEPTTQVFQIYFAAFNKNNGGTILIDNLKLLYLE
ncbi:MAG: hypothetical protein ACXWEY_10950 [Bacteroidia bacterium]